MGSYATTSQIKVPPREVESQQELLRGRGTSILQAARANHEVPETENKMQRCRCMGGCGLTRGKGGSSQEAVIHQESW
jgi:hypothetical protein